MSDTQILTADQMRSAEHAIFDKGMTEFDLMKIAASGAAEWVRRIAARRSVTILCGPGNNGGDGYVIAHHLRRFGNEVEVVAPVSPQTETAKKARELWGGDVLTSGSKVENHVFVDCLFGSGLARPLSGEHALMLRDLAERHEYRIALDVPSGIASDSGAVLNDKLPQWDLTLALGAWKFAHWSLPGRAAMGTLKLVPIGVDPVDGAAQLVQKPKLSAPGLAEHKYTRGLAVVVSGEMPGAAHLSCRAAMRAGAGYVKLFSDDAAGLSDPSLVVDRSSLDHALSDPRINAVLVGPGLGRTDKAQEKLTKALAAKRPTVLDADALVALTPGMVPEDLPILATPHDGELDRLCRSFCVIAEGHMDKAMTLAKVSKMVIIAKGPDTIIAAPDGKVAIAGPAPSWLSVAGTGDVLAGIAVSRMANGSSPFEAACEAVWLHGEAARLCGPAFTPAELGEQVSAAFRRCM